MRRLYYWLENGMLRGITIHLLFVLAIIVGISLVAGGIVYPGHAFDSYWDAVWWAFLRLSDPGYLGEDYGIVRRTTSLIVTILGYVLFLGALVAILTNWLNRSMARLQQGRSAVVEKDHFVILGWSKHVPAIVREFALSQERVRLRIGRRQPRVVILLPEMAPRYLQRVDDALRGLSGRLKVVYRVGNPLVVDDLRRIAVEKANTVILVATGETKEERAVSDTRTVKSLLSLSRIRGATDSPLEFSGVAELTYSLHTDLIHETARNSRIEILASDGLLSRIIAQALRRPGAAAVFAELFVQGRGQQVYLIPVPPAWGRNVHFEATYRLLAHGLPIGVKRVSGHGHQPMLNPEPGLALEPGDELIVLAASLREASKRARKTSAAPSIPNDRATPMLPSTPPEHRLLILNWNSRVTAILRELDTYQSERFDVTIVSSRPPELIRQALSRYAPDLERVDTHIHQGDPAFPHDLSQFSLSEFSSVLLVASDRFHDTESSDARTLMSFLRLQRRLAGMPHQPEILVEVLDPLNGSFYQGDNVSVLVSQDIVSHSLAQIALRPDLNEIYAELTSAGGAEIDFMPSRALLQGDIISFERIVARAGHCGMVAIGVRQSGEVHLNPPRQSEWQVDEGLDIIVLASHGT